MKINDGAALFGREAAVGIVGLGLTFAATLSEASTQPLEQQPGERLKQLENALGAVNNLQQAILRLAKEKKLQCITALGTEPVCECLATNIPIAVPFAQYVVIVTQSREDLSYDTLPIDAKKVIDNTRNARDKCIGAAGG